MEIRYTDRRDFTSQQLEKLFLSVEWESGQFPIRLKKAMDGCATVFTAWDGDELIGLVNAVDDGELTAYVHYLLVSPEYQGKGVGKKLLELITDKYRDYRFLFLVAEKKDLVGYYEKLGFEEHTKSVMVYKND